ncbi:MAG: hypothetical protein WCI51_21395, partial [Lentisphaerota bacterium]
GCSAVRAGRGIGTPLAERERYPGIGSLSEYEPILKIFAIYSLIFSRAEYMSGFLPDFFADKPCLDCCNINFKKLY